ncbi:amino acid ABC transporter substrate-binding protein [Aeromicrobium flavum]|uniref:Amino acid ABC transporter substrate-binding protein n=1 Tax=Aeromicrobium flavum TaxID=416568 RepID=A0A512HY29_9ACTN|nr:ABC transporter substrate-binding protein [Aeromicrobium flavum]GEO90351.1 amino acid ABC transporter substrate-binding protein [Aeromicrobium flavum]
MKRSTTTLRLAALASASALVLAACGGGDDSSDDKDKEVAKGDGEFVVGSLLPQTGSLAFLGPPEFAGVDLAVKEINAAGGVLGKDARHVKGDSGDTDSGIAPTETDKLIKAKSDVIVGAASSGVSMTVIDKILAAGVVQYSPANTSTDFDNGKYGKPDLYFRTAPSDILQGAVLANLLVQEGKQNVAILARQDSYGETLAAEVKKGLEAAGSKVAVTSFYGEKAPSYDAQIDEVAAAKPDAVLLIAFDETKKIIPQLVGKGVGPQDVATYFVDGNVADYSKESFAPQLKGVKGTVPGADAGDEFKKRLLEINPKLTDYSYAAESYDAVVTSALAAIAADNESGEAIAAELVEITKGGEKCTTFQQCADLLAEDKDIDYDGVSGPIEFGETGSPTSASIGIYEYDAKGTYKGVDYIAGDI